MKAAESKTTTATQALQAKAEAQQPFFQAQSEQQGAFFGQEAPAAKPFFSPFIQTKLSIGQPGDKYEQEADAMAEQVVQKLSSGKTEAPIQRKCAECAAEEEGIAPKLQLKSIFESNEEPAGGQLQRKCEACTAEKIQPMRIQRMGKEEEPELQAKGEVTGLQASADLESRLNSTKGGGSPLSDETRSSMESSFGTDFSGVRVHTNSGAVQMNQELGAQAFTHGSDVYFNSGKYNPGSTEGNRLLGHELTHVVQQGGGIQAKIQLTSLRDYGDASIRQHDPSNLTDVQIRATSEFQSIDAMHGTGHQVPYRYYTPAVMLLGCRLMLRAHREGDMGALNNEIHFLEAAQRQHRVMAEVGRQGGNLAGTNSVQWEQQSVHLTGTEFGRWLLSGGSRPNPRAGTMNCWEVVLFGANELGYISEAQLRAFYTTWTASLQSTSAAGGNVLTNTSFESRFRAGQEYTFDPANADSPRPLPGDIVVFNTAVRHTAIALGNSTGSPQLYSLWNEPNNHLYLQRITVDTLLNQTSASGPVKFWRPNW